MKFKFGICFSRPLEGTTPLSHLDRKLPTYLRFLELCRQKDWDVYILTRKTYQGNGRFAGVWPYDKGKFILTKEPVDIDLVYDLTGGLYFPPEETGRLKVVNRRDFKVLAADKWLSYQAFGEFMPTTYWVGKKENLVRVLPQIKSDWVVLKPTDGLKGIGIYVGPKAAATDFEFAKSYPQYVAQEFLDTSGGISGLVTGKHDLRVVITNNQVVWCHVRTPPAGEFTANVARGGTITEVDYQAQVPESIKKIVAQIAPVFYRQYDNPVFSLDFGFGPAGPRIFEINDRVGFPRWEMKNRDRFLMALIKNFEMKLEAKS